MYIAHGLLTEATGPVTKERIMHPSKRPARQMLRPFPIGLLIGGLLMTATACGPNSASVGDTNYPAAAHVPDSRAGWETEDADAPLDEAQGGRTALGTTITKRSDACFPAETRNVFSSVDRVASGPNGELQPLDFSENGRITPRGREAIRGQNTWMLWGEGNEVFWNWLAERGYGLVDFLVLLDSRKRGQRFKNDGLINQPGMKSQTDWDKRVLGLYLDVANGTRITLQQPPSDIDSTTGTLAVRPAQPSKHPTELFRPGDEREYKRVLAQLPSDGLDESIYGYPSGVLGLRLMPNPDFFGDTTDAARARAKWNEVVVEDTKGAYYTDPAITADPELVRPFRVSMSCAFCHLAPHPLAPPENPEEPEWENLSTTIGNQYWMPQAIFANVTRPDNFLHHFLKSQQPGTIDTSLVSTDHINNANTINAIFDVPARLERALLNPMEEQSQANLLLPGVEDGNRPDTRRHTPRVLIDGSDSIGVFGALSRVYLNIGTFPEEWARCHNPIIGFKPQRPFSVATLERNSSYWRAGVKHRIGYLQAFFTEKERKTGASVTQPMKLAATKEGKAIVAAEAAQAALGREVFFQNCAICHSSKQPEGFALDFAADWERRVELAGDRAMHLTLPLAFRDWEAFKQSGPYLAYVKRLQQEIEKNGGPDGFLRDNYLSTDIRIPVTLVGTNSGRAVGTNGMRGQVWDNFSSEDYKKLPAVGQVHFFNPFAVRPADPWGNNDVYTPPAGGPGYYRPATLISLWSTAPYLHNNALGLFNGDPSVAGRLRAFDDGINKLLWNDRRSAVSMPHPGDLRTTQPELARGDTGFIYRTPQTTYIQFAPKFIRPIVESMLGPALTSIATWYAWLALAVVSVLLAVFAGPRVAGFVSLLLAIALATVVVVLRVDKVYAWVWIFPLLPTALAVWLWLDRERRVPARVFFVLVAIAGVGGGYALKSFVDGARGDLRVGPIPAGTPVNLLMNINPEAPREDLIRAVAAATRAVLTIRKEEAEGAKALEIFQEQAGAPLLRASKCPDFVLDRGHWFGEALSDVEKYQLKAFLKTL
jgi:hypothetical protein